MTLEEKRTLAAEMKELIDKLNEKILIADQHGMRVSVYQGLGLRENAKSNNIIISIKQEYDFLR